MGIANDPLVELTRVVICPGYCGRLPPEELAKVMRLDVPGIPVEVEATA